MTIYYLVTFYDKNKTDYKGTKAYYSYAEAEATAEMELRYGEIGSYYIRYKR